MNSYYIIRVKGNINRFLINCNINLIKVKYISRREIVVKIKKEDYKDLVKMYRYNFKIINSDGLDKILFLIKRYRIFFISFIIGIILLIILSNVIFSIKITSNNKELNNLVRKELLNYGIEKYKFKKNYKTNNKIKELIKEKYKDKIEWIEITNNGTRVDINIIERKINNINNNDQIYSIVAKKPGFIKNIIVYDGIKLVDENNYVNKGDIIISSDIYLNENLKGKVSANGKVYASVWYKVICEYPLNYKEKQYTNRKRKTIYFKIGNKYIDFFRYKTFDRKIIYSVNDKLTNIEFGIEEIEKVNIINKKYSNKAAIKAASKKSTDVIKKRLKRGEYIISQKTLKFNNNGSKIILEMFFSVYEEIGEKRVIEESNNG